MRLCDALKGDARDATRSLFVAGNHSKDIIKTLEMRFGNQKLILNNIIQEFRGLPNIDSRQMSLVEFATRLRNTVIAIKSIDNHLGYLCSPELSNDLNSKLPISMISNYVRFAASEGSNKTELEKVSEFLFKEAEMSIQAGIITPSARDSQISSHRGRAHHNNSMQGMFVGAVMAKKHSFPSGGYAHCKRKNHLTHVCRDFSKMPSAYRWRLAKTTRLYYNCLEEGHDRGNCQKNTYFHCQRKHHTLLHYSDNYLKRINSNTLSNNFSTQIQLRSSENAAETVKHQS